MRLAYIGFVFSVCLLVSATVAMVAKALISQPIQTKTLKVSAPINATPVIQAQPSKPTNLVALPTIPVEVINLNEDNMVVMDQVFNEQSVSMVMLDIKKLSDKLGTQDTIYLVLSSPGGSVDAGLRLLSYIKALPQKVKTLTLFAASMGFQTAQELDERLILDTGTLMSHRGSFGCKGEARGEIETCMRYSMALFDAMETKAAQRMGMTFKAYLDLIRDEYWAYGQDAVNEKAADRVVLAKCGKGLDGTKMQLVDTFFGTFNVEVSKCPLIPGYISVQPMDAKAKQDTGVTTLYVKGMFSNKSGFVKEFITTNKWTQFQK